MIPEPNFPAKPDEFVGRKPQLEAFRQALRQGIVTGRTPSFAVLGEWGIGKSSLLSKCSAICEEPEFEMLPVPFSVSNELGDYRRFAELLLDTLGGCLARAQSVQARIRGEAQNWNLKRVNVGPVALERETPKLFLTSGTAICRQYQRLAHAGDKLDAAEHWDEIFRRLGKEKFSADLAQVTEREVQLLRALARCEEQEVNRKEFADYARIYFTRLTDKGLLIRTGRGHYRLYHPLFREFLRQTK